VAEAMSEERLAQIEKLAAMNPGCDSMPILYSRALSEALAEVKRLNTVLDANRVVRNAAESSSRTYKSVVDMLKIQRTELRDEIDRLRAAQPQLTDEYGLRIHHVSTLTEERAIADTLAGALEVLEAFDAKGREGVVSRELLVRGVEEWRKAAEVNRG